MTITADQLRRARRTIGITQAKLAEESGVNSTLIKHLETDRLSILPAPAQESLVAYFKQKGVDLDSSEASKLDSGKSGISPVPRGAIPVPPGTVSPRMSFTISETLSDQDVESALARMDKNDEEIADLMRKVTAKGVWGGYTDETIGNSQRLFGLMAENYMLFRYMQGTNILEGIDPDAKETHAHIVQKAASDSGSPLIASNQQSDEDPRTDKGTKSKAQGQPTEAEA